MPGAVKKTGEPVTTPAVPATTPTVAVSQRIEPGSYALVPPGGAPGNVPADQVAVLDALARLYQSGVSPGQVLKLLAGVQEITGK